MNEINLARHKKHFSSQALSDGKFRNFVKEIFKKSLGMDTVPDFTYTTKKIIFTTHNKAAAQELFMARDLLIQRLKKDVVIR